MRGIVSSAALAALIVGTAISGGAASQARADDTAAAEPVIWIESAWAGRHVLALPDGTWERFVIRRADEQVKLVRETTDDFGRTWSQPQPLTDVPAEQRWGGVAALRDDRGDVHLFISSGRGQGQPAVDRFIDIWHMKSDGGLDNWTDPQRIFEGYVGALSKGIQLRSGRIVLPFGAWVGGRPTAPPTGANVVTVLYSDDRGGTWTPSDAALVSPCYEDYNGANVGACEPAILELGDGRVWMVMRTQAGFLYESFSEDGAVWSHARQSRFHSSTGPPELIRLSDGGIMLFWNNAEMPPRVDGAGVYGGRDALHAAISHDEGWTWHGYREIYLDPHRHESPPRRGDRGTAYPEALPADDGRVAVISGQGGRRALILVDPQWLYEKHREDDFSRGLDGWTAFKAFGPAEGWWRDRTQGARIVPHPDQDGAQVLHVRRPDDLHGDGAVWNFPAGTRGTLQLSLRLNEGFGGGAIALNDRFFDPDDDNGEAQALFLLPIDADGRIGDGPALAAGRWHTLEVRWDTIAQQASVSLDGQPAGELAMRHPTPTGVTYLRLRSTAADVDQNGMFIERVSARIDQGPQP